MKWLTIDYIKQHSRIDFDCEDQLLEEYGDSAEQTIMRLIGRDYDDIVTNFGTDDVPIPADLIHATMLLVDVSYNHRSPVSPQNLYGVGYTFDLLIKPFMRLTGTFIADQRIRLCTRLEAMRTDLDYFLAGKGIPDEAEALYDRIKTNRLRIAGVQNPTDRILKRWKSDVDALEKDVSDYLDTLVNPEP